MIDVRGKNVTVAGLGRFGGGIAVARWLVANDAKVLVTDQSTPDDLAGAMSQLAGLRIEYRLGEHREADFTSTDLVVASPAIPPANRYLAAARSAGVPITTEICLFAERCPVPIVAVTGTKGKSTTSALLEKMLATRFKTWLGGNIGKSLLDDLPRMSPEDLVVLELSSFMLHYLGERRWSPRVAVVTLLAPDHLDWHGSMDAYLGAKRNILRWQKPEEIAIVNEESPIAIEWVSDREELPLYAEENISPVQAMIDAPQKLWRERYGVSDRKPFDLLIPGRHNQLNAQGAFAAARFFGISWDSAQSAVSGFTGLRHRLELVHESAGVRWFNDSIATIPEAAAAALAAFPSGTVIHIVGGKGKGLDLTPMIAPLAKSAKAVLTIGQTGAEVSRLVREAGGKCVDDCQTLDYAVRRAKELCQPGDVVLLSTGFASYDQFTNFEARGETFTGLASLGST